MSQNIAITVHTFSSDGRLLGRTSCALVDTLEMCDSKVVPLLVKRHAMNTQQRERSPHFSLDRRLGGPQTRSGLSEEEKSPCPCPCRESNVVNRLRVHTNPNLSALRCSSCHFSSRLNYTNVKSEQSLM